MHVEYFFLKKGAHKLKKNKKDHTFISFETTINSVLYMKKQNTIFCLMNHTSGKKSERLKPSHKQTNFEYQRRMTLYSDEKIAIAGELLP